MTANQDEVNQWPFHESVIPFIKKADSSDEMKALGNIVLRTLVPERGPTSISAALVSRIADFFELGRDFFLRVTDSLFRQKTNPTEFDWKPFHLSVIDAIKEEDSEDGLKVLIELAIDTIKPEGKVGAIVKVFSDRASDFPGLGEKFFALHITTLLYRDSFQRNLERVALKAQ